MLTYLHIYSFIYLHRWERNVYGLYKRPVTKNNKHQKSHDFHPNMNQKLDIFSMDVLHRNSFVCTVNATRKRVPRKNYQKMNKCINQWVVAVFYTLLILKKKVAISCCLFILDRHMKKVFVLWSGHKYGTKKKCRVL